MSSTFSDATPECQVCDAPTQFMGRLGRLDWWTCRCCGTQSYTPAYAEDEREAPACRRPRRRNRDE